VTVIFGPPFIYQQSETLTWIVRNAATANCQTGKEEELTTGRWHDLVKQLHVRSFPDLLYDRS